MFTVFLGIGTNLGDKLINIQKALSHIENRLGKITQKSNLYETKAWGGIEQDNYYNLAVEIETEYFPLALIKLILEIETDLGRTRNKKWESRIIDIDILLFENYHFASANLVVPHLYLEKRNFVLHPLNELCPYYLHPKRLKSITQLLESCEDTAWIKQLPVL